MKLVSALFESHDPFAMFDKVEVVNTPEELDTGVLLLHGGEDISPTIYNHKVSRYCNATDKLSNRDIKELALIKRAVELDMPIIGICRGAQLLCAVDGGHLVQDILGHTHKHLVQTPEGLSLGYSNSAHHQMMQPRKSNTNIVLGEVAGTIHGFDQHDKLREYPSAIEVVYFGKLNALAIQGHPEWMKPTDEFVLNLKKLIKEHLL